MSKGTEEFRQTIERYIMSRQDVDINKYSDKNINNCINYILTQVEKSQCNGFTDDEIYSLAVHYYDEPNETLGDIQKDISMNCVVNHHVELTEEEKAEIKKNAMDKLMKEEMDRMKAKPQKKPQLQQQTMKQTELTLF